MTTCVLLAIMTLGDCAPVSSGRSPGSRVTARERADRVVLVFPKLVAVASVGAVD